MFDPRELADLQNIPIESRHDAKFVKMALEQVYKNDLEKLMCRSIKGIEERSRSFKGVMSMLPSKPAFTPEKLRAVRSQYNMRIQANCMDSTEFAKRISDKYFNKLLNSVLSNRMKKTQIEMFHVLEEEPHN